MKEMTSSWGSIAFAPDGKTLVFVADDGIVCFWNLATQREILTEEYSGGLYARAKFSADGEYLALPLTLRRAPSLAEIETNEKANAEARLAAGREAGK
jgi:hypothetical protein